MGITFQELFLKLSQNEVHSVFIFPLSYLPLSSSQFLLKQQFDGVIWGTIVSKDRMHLILDVRDLECKSIRYFSLSLTSFELRSLESGNDGWWSNLEAFDGTLFTSKYLDPNDPTQKSYFKWPANVPTEVSFTEIPRSEHLMTHPSIYELGSEYHRAVSSFLSLEIACSCEYLEINKKIILSYYLRSSKQLDRYLLILDAGEKALKLKQDESMMGFAPGAFFVLDNKLFFVKNRNEICIHSL